MTKIPTQGIFKLPSVIHFQNNVTCDFSRKNTEAHSLLPKRFWYCHSDILLHETSNSVINCIITQTRLWPTKFNNIITKIYLTSRTTVNVLHSFQKVKRYTSTGILRFLVYIQYTYLQYS